ncbi:hypothetical protein GCM10010372_50840 [Streptomyces tauricus]|nr:hypothetical protein GCM10010372_50840 [Streptomyces tauricus]
MRDWYRELDLLAGGLEPVIGAADITLNESAGQGPDRIGVSGQRSALALAGADVPQGDRAVVAPGARVRPSGEKASAATYSRRPGVRAPESSTRVGGGGTARLVNSPE